jgi:hypothetical protein
VRNITEFRIYGTVFGLTEEDFAKLKTELPFENLSFSNSVLDIDHEGPWVDVEEALDRLTSRLGPDGRGGLDVIDNHQWQITRYALRPGGYDSRTFDLDNVMEHVRPN